LLFAGVIQVGELDKRTGWIVHKLRQLRHIPTLATSGQAAKPTAEAATRIVNLLDCGEGAYLAKDEHGSTGLAPGQALTQGSTEFCHFMVIVEWLTATVLLTRQNLMRHQANLLLWTLQVLSKCKLLRQLWANCLSDLGFEANTTEQRVAAVAVLRAIIIFWMKSRARTYRLNNGLVAETNRSCALRTFLKTYAVDRTTKRAASVHRSVDDTISCLVAVVKHFGSSIDRSGMEIGLVALVNKRHGVVFDRCGDDVIVSELPKRFLDGCVYGNVMLGDVVTEILAPNARADDVRPRARVPTVSQLVGKGGLQASHLPILVKLKRKPAGRPSLKRATTDALPPEGAETRTTEAEVRPVKRRQTRAPYHGDDWTY
jgi:hypothetical protein